MVAKRCLYVLALASLVAAYGGAARANERDGPPPRLVFELQRRIGRQPWLPVTTDSSRQIPLAQRIDQAGLGGLASRALGGAPSLVAGDTPGATTPGATAVVRPPHDTLTADAAIPSNPTALPPSANAPAPGALMRLDDRLVNARRIRVTTPSGSVVAAGVRAGAEGLAYEGLLATTRGDALSVPGRIPWDATLQVDVRGNHSARATVVSAIVLGALYGLSFAAMKPGDEMGDAIYVVYSAPVVLVLAAGVGAAIPAWHRVYHSRPARASAR